MTDFHNAREAAERLLTDVIWRSPTVGSCQCPGADKHSSGDGTCAVFVDRGWPVIHCFHDSCADEVRAFNGELLRSAPEGVRQERKWTAVEKSEWQHCRAIEYEARTNRLPKLLALPPMSADDWLRLSPVRIPEKPLDQWRLFVGSMFAPDDLIWSGETWWSGKDEYAHTFRTAAEWQKTEFGPLGEQMTLVTFHRRSGYDLKKGTVYFEGHERVLARVANFKYSLVECDSIDRGLFSNVQRALARRKEFVLRAVVYTGGKSYHAWYDSLRYHPDVKQLAALLRGLGADRQGLTHITARAPGTTRFDDNGSPVGEQQLLYLNPATLL